VKSDKAKKGVCRRAGNRERQIKKYYEVTMPARKLRHLLRNNSYPEAQAFASKHSCTGLMLSIAREIGIGE